MLRGMETTVESSGKSATQEQVKSIQEQLQGKATQEQVKALSDAVHLQHARIEQLHASMQLILQKLNP